MAVRKFTDEQLLAALSETRSTSALAKKFDVSARAVVTRLRKLNVPPARHAKEAQGLPTRAEIERSIGRISTTITDGRAVIFSDAHFQPDCISTANRALLKLLPQLRPSVVVCNGDAFDGSAVSRHSPMFGDRPHTPAAELRACQERLTEIAELSRGALRIWTLGNHDIRLHTYLATSAPALADMPGLDLRALFPEWKFCWSLRVNDDTVIKHRYRGGMYAPANNVRGALGMSFVTGHLHSLKVMPLSAYANKPIAYGVDTGMLAEPEWSAFNYREDSPADWRSGFVVMTWRGGRLLWPEVVNVVGEGVVEFRGELMQV